MLDLCKCIAGMLYSSVWTRKWIYSCHVMLVAKFSHNIIFPDYNDLSSLPKEIALLSNLEDLFLRTYIAWWWLYAVVLNRNLIWLVISVIRVCWWCLFYNYNLSDDNFLEYIPEAIGQLTRLQALRLGKYEIVKFL